MKNNKIRNEISVILNKLQNNGIKIFVQSDGFDNSDIYVRGAYTNLLTIKEEISKYFPMCETDFVHGCYVPFEDGRLECDNRTEDAIHSSWCITKPCPSPKVLEIIIPTIDEENIIKEIFKNNI